MQKISVKPIEILRTTFMNENHNINITATASFVETESDSKQNRYTFAYTITITNTGKRAAQLLKRHWILTNGNGKIEEVHGDGVIGMKPRINTGESFRYTSSALLETDVGIMQGYYTFRDDDGETFNAQISPFTLTIPRTLH
jgi:ApaG protein